MPFKSWKKKYGKGGVINSKKVTKYAKGGGHDYEGEAYGTTSMSDYATQDNEEQQAIDKTNYDSGKRSNAYNTMYGGNGGGSKAPSHIGPKVNSGTLSVSVPTNYAKDKYTKEILGIEKKKPKMSTLDKFRQKSMTKFTTRTKASNLKELGMVDKKFSTIGGIPIGFTGAFAEAFHVPKETASFDKNSIKEIGAQLSKSKTGITKSQNKSLSDLKQDIDMEDRLKAGTVKQSEFNKYMNRNKTVNNTGGDGGGDNRCPDGSMPPCVTATPVATPVVAKKKDPFFSKFKAYDKGGLTRTVPPKRGPNPIVPPVKMRKGKMTKAYKNSCPHRPDGIRGVGSAIRGHKFVGVR